jgi:hypothetical protein
MHLRLCRFGRARRDQRASVDVRAAGDFGRRHTFIVRHSNVAASCSCSVSRSARLGRFCHTDLDRHVGAAPGAAFGAGGRVAVLGYAAAVVVRARILRFRARYVGSVGSAQVFGYGRSLPNFTQPHVHWRGYHSRGVVHPLGFSHAAHLRGPVHDRVPPSRSAP